MQCTLTRAFFALMTFPHAMSRLRLRLQGRPRRLLRGLHVCRPVGALCGAGRPAGAGRLGER
eukprot:365270-Chlamydomonas_euryale.AAC.19